MSRILAFVLVPTLALGAVRAEDPQPQTPETTPASQELDLIRDQLVALDIEKALLALKAILERPDLTDATRAAALDLRAQAHVASDDLNAAEKDYRALLELNAGYEPGRAVTSKKAMERFVKIRAATIGTIHLDVEPKDASLALDGRPVSAPEGGTVSALAGERRIRLTRRGFDAQDVTTHVVAGEETLVKVRLVPNARSLVLRTDIDGVSVTLDGVASGVTARQSDVGSGSETPASLLIEDVAIGEHEIRYAKPCFATETVQEAVSVDMADRSPKVTRVVSMRPARTRVTAIGALYDGELRIDGEPAATLPLTGFTMCPGTRNVEVIASGRVVWSGVLDAEESDLELDLAPRPNAVLVGADWPSNWGGAISGWSRRGRVDVPSGANMTVSEGWRVVSLPPGTDLAIGVLERAGLLGEDRIVLYGPALHEVEECPSPPRSPRPRWSAATLGIVLVDGGAGSVVIAVVRPQGPAAKVGLLSGDRLLAISGRPVTDAKSATNAIAAAPLGAKLELEIGSPSGASRMVECLTTASPALAPIHGGEESRVMRAAWASVDAAAGGPDAPAALANLAVLLERSENGEAALDAWRRVRTMGNAALVPRAAYAVGAGLQSAGKDAEAIDAFRAAKAEALAREDALLAAAANDRLADLGVTPP